MKHIEYLRHDRNALLHSTATVHFKFVSIYKVQYFNYISSILNLFT